MNLPINIIVGNGISLIAGIFLVLSMVINNEKEAYKYQFLNAFVLMISSFFFYSWTGVTTMAIAATRNMMVYKDRLTFNWTVFFIILSVVLGLGKYYGLYRSASYNCYCPNYNLQLFSQTD